ncbi:hypothetical protein [Shewanella chilikensis]|uniref:hypothetical protein n=1 Tax=Shewanella chilikensis TaxID=558541 RepID=UPI001F29D4F3|nr:hypothetical protein [Shewanella chilikensis]MCE9786413.1 hypothetical protein [Shewanella chilikensis]
MSFTSSPVGDGKLIYIDADNGCPCLYLYEAADTGSGYRLVWSTDFPMAEGTMQVSGCFHGVPGREQSCVVWDQQGCIYLVDLARRQQEFLAHTGMEYLKVAVLSDGRTLASLGENDRRCCYDLMLWHWLEDRDLSPSAVIQLNDEVDNQGGPWAEVDATGLPDSMGLSFTDRLFAGPDNSLILHCHRSRRRRSQAWQFLLRLDPMAVVGSDPVGSDPVGSSINQVQWQGRYSELLQVAAMPLPNPPGNEALWECALALDSERGELTLPAMTLSRAQDTETEALAYQLQRIDLRLGREIGRFCVRQYTREQLADDADMLLAPADVHNLDWQEALGRFWLQLDDIAYCDDEAALRLGWHGGATRKVSLDGQWRSPLYLPDGEDDLYDEEGMKLLGKGALLTDWHYLWRFNPNPTLELASQMNQAPAAMEASFAVQLQQTEWSSFHAHAQAQGQDTVPPLLGFSRIEVRDLQSASARLEALDKLVLRALTDFESLKSGQDLRLGFYDAAESWDEARFFEAVALQLEGQNYMARLLGLFIANEQLHYCYSDPYSSKPALADCALQLGLAGSQYLPLVAQYLNCIDVDHELFFQQDGNLDTLLGKYADTPDGEDFNRLLPYEMSHQDEDDYQ